MSEEPKKSLVAKIAEACGAVGGIEKKGKNEKQNYKYLKAADVAKAIRHEFFSRGVILVFDEKEFVQIRTIKTNSGGEMGEFMLRTEVTFYDADSDSRLGPFGAYGVAMDTGDKAIWKAKTGALKYVLRGIGLIPDEKDDPEADGKVDEETGTNRVQQAEEKFQERTGGQRASIALVNAFQEMFSKSGKTEKQLTEILRVRYSAERPDQLTKEELQELVKWAAGKEGLEDTLRTSVTAATGRAQEAPVDSGLPSTPPDSPQRNVGRLKVSEKQIGRLYAIAQAHSVNQADVHQYIKETYGYESTKDLDRTSYDEVCKWLEGQ